MFISVSEYVNTCNKFTIPDPSPWIYKTILPQIPSVLQNPLAKRTIQKVGRNDSFGHSKSLNNTTMPPGIFVPYVPPAESKGPFVEKAETTGFQSVIFWWDPKGSFGWFPRSQKSSRGHFFRKDSSKLKLPLLSVGPLFLLPSANTKTRWWYPSDSFRSNWTMNDSMIN